MQILTKEEQAAEVRAVPVVARADQAVVHQVLDQELADLKEVQAPLDQAQVLQAVAHLALVPVLQDLERELLVAELLVVVLQAVENKEVLVQADQVLEQPALREVQEVLVQVLPDLAQEPVDRKVVLVDRRVVQRKALVAEQDQVLVAQAEVDQVLQDRERLALVQAHPDQDLVLQERAPLVLAQEHPEAVLAAELQVAVLRALEQVVQVVVHQALEPQVLVLLDPVLPALEHLVAVQVLVPPVVVQDLVLGLQAQERDNIEGC